MRDPEGSDLLAQAFNLLTDEQIKTLPKCFVDRTTNFLFKNDYRIRFGSWYLPKTKSPYRNERV